MAASASVTSRSVSDLDVPVAVMPSAMASAQALFDQAAGVALGQADDAPQLALPDAAFDGEQQLAQLLGRVGPMASAWARMWRVSRDGLNTRSSSGSTTVPGRSARAWVRSNAWVFRSRISMRRSNSAHQHPAADGAPGVRRSCCDRRARSCRRRPFAGLR